MGFTAPVPFPVHLRALTLLWEPWNPRSEPFLRLEIMAAGNHDVFFRDFMVISIGFPWDFQQCKWWIFTWLDGDCSWHFFATKQLETMEIWMIWKRRVCEREAMVSSTVRWFTVLKNGDVQSFFLYVYQRVMDDYWMMNGISLLIFLWTLVI